VVGPRTPSKEPALPDEEDRALPDEEALVHEGHPYPVPLDDSYASVDSDNRDEEIHSQPGFSQPTRRR
jgi:hypothetical protein